MIIMIEGLSRLVHSYGSGNTALLTALTGYIFYYLLQVVHVPRLVCRKGKWRGFIESNLKVVKDKYWPTFWCVESRAQTVLASIIRARIVPAVNYTRDVVSLSDGGEVALDWLYPDNTFTHVAIFLPGLTGDSQADYIKSLVLIAHNEGAAAVVFNNRGRGGLELKTPRTYCACNCEDFCEVLNYIRSKHPDKYFIGTGVSLGGMILGHYLVSKGSDADLLCGMMVSVAYNTDKGMRNLEENFWNFQLNKHLAGCLRGIVNKYIDKFEEHGKCKMEEVLESKTIRDFDARFTAPMFNYPSVEAYYRAASLHDKLHHIKVPLLCLSSADDPFQPAEGYPVEAIEEECSSVAMVLTNHGGHIGFMEGFIPSQQYMEKLFQQYLQAAMKNTEELVTLRH